jgi:hypothetical protein
MHNVGYFSLAEDATQTAQNEHADVHWREMMQFLTARNEAAR